MVTLVELSPKTHEVITFWWIETNLQAICASWPGRHFPLRSNFWTWTPREAMYGVCGFLHDENSNVRPVYRWMHGIISNSNNAIKEPTHRYQICEIGQILIFGGYLKVRESLHTQVIICVNIVWNHIDTMAILPKIWRFLHSMYTQMVSILILWQFYLGVKVFARYVHPNGIENKSILHTLTLLVQKLWNPYYRYPNGTKKRHQSTTGKFNSSLLISYLPKFKRERSKIRLQTLAALQIQTF